MLMNLKVNKFKNVFNNIRLEPSAESIDTIAAFYHSNCPDTLPAKVGTVFSVKSRLLPHFKDEGMTQDRLWVIETADDDTARFMNAVIQNTNHASVEPICSHTRITGIEDEISKHVDCTIVFRHSSVVDKHYDLEKLLKLVYEHFQVTPLAESVGRTVPILIVDNAGAIPDEFPFHQLSLSNNINVEDMSTIQKELGELNYCVIRYAEDNPDAIKRELQETIAVAKEHVAKLPYRVRSSSAIMFIATAKWLVMKAILCEADIQEMLHWLQTEAISRSTMTDAICREFKSAVSGAILSGELTITKQYGPPYYSDDGHTAFIREEDKSVNMDDDTINNVIIPKISTRSVVKMNKHLNEKGLLKGKHTNKRKLKVAYDADVLDDVEVFSYSRSVLNAEAKAYVDALIDSEFWFAVGEYPDGFVPILYNADGTRAAGYVFKPDMDDNLHEVYFGTTRSGKTFALVNRAVEKVEVEGIDAVIVFDQTGGFTPTEIDKHIGKDQRVKYFSFWNIYEDGLPVDLLDLRGCLTYTEKKDRLTRIFAMMSRTLGSYEEQIIKNAVKGLLKEMKRNPDVIASDIEKYIYEEGDANDEENPLGDKTHRKLRYKIDAVLDDLKGSPQTKNNWGEFAKDQGKPIVVISTGADGVGKGSEIIDIMLESLYGYKQCHPDSRYTIVIDEAQDLYLHEKGAVNTLLRKGGKHGVKMLLASQSYPDPTTPFGKVVGNCGRIRGYRSKGDDLARYADRFGCDKHEADSLQKGNCFDNGPFWSRYRRENVIKTLKGRTVTVKSAPEENKNHDEQPYGCSEGGEENGKEGSTYNAVPQNLV